MLAKLNLMNPMVVAGAVAAAIAAAPAVASDTFAPDSVTVQAPPAAGQVVLVDHALTHQTFKNLTFKTDPGGSGCDVHGNCGSGGQNQGPGGGPGGHGCIPGVGCGSGGQFAGPGGVPGGQGCIPGVGCGSGHG